MRLFKEVKLTSQEKINALLRGELAAQNKTQAALAEACGLNDRQQIVNRLAGKIEWKTSEFFAAVEFLGFADVADFFALAEEREKRIERK